MNHYIVSYQDNEGYEATTTIESADPITEKEVRELLNEQLSENGINAFVIQVRIEKTTKAVGKIKHFLHNNSIFPLKTTSF